MQLVFFFASTMLASTMLGGKTVQSYAFLFDFSVESLQSPRFSRVYFRGNLRIVELLVSSTIIKYYYYR